jgi:hypothetical protein
LLIPETGFYLLQSTASTLSSSGHETAIDGTTELASLVGSASTSAVRDIACAVAALNEGDWLALLDHGSAQYEFGAAETELSAIML